MGIIIDREIVIIRVKGEERKIGKSLKIEIIYSKPKFLEVKVPMDLISNRDNFLHYFRC